MDANSKLGPDMIKGDPHAQSDNGKILSAIIKRNALCVINSSEDKCKGKITRKRSTKTRQEESIIDFVISCDEMGDMIEELVIDESKQYALSKYKKTKNGVKVIESDHNSLVTKVKAVWKKKHPENRIEMYNLKDINGLKKFREITSRDNFLSGLFEEEGNIEIKTKKFLKRLNYCLSVSFNKIRINKSRKNKELEELFNRRRILRNKCDDRSFESLKEVEKKLAEICASDNLNIIKEACEGLTVEGGGVNAGKLWKLKKQLQGIYQEPPTAMLDAKGNLITTNKALEQLSMDMYKERLKSHQINENFKVHQMQRENLWQKRFKEAQGNVTPDWTMQDLEVVLKQLKNKKSRDPLGLANELFKPENAGDDLKLALLKMSNEIKNQHIFPKALGLCNISSL